MFVKNRKYGKRLKIEKGETFYYSELVDAMYELISDIASKNISKEGGVFDSDTITPKADYEIIVRKLG